MLWDTSNGLNAGRELAGLYGAKLGATPSLICPFDFIFSMFSFILAAFDAFCASILSAELGLFADIVLTVFSSCLTKADFKSVASFSVSFSPSSCPTLEMFPCIKALMAASCLAVCSLNTRSSVSLPEERSLRSRECNFSSDFLERFADRGLDLRGDLLELLCSADPRVGVLLRGDLLRGERDRFFGERLRGE